MIRILIIASFLQLFSTAMALAEEQQQHLLINSMENYIVPAYQQLDDSTNSLAEQITELCRMPSLPNLQNVRGAFHQTVRAWSAVEWFRVGPVMQNNRVERFFFFPDRKSRGLRQVQAALANQDKDVLDTAELQRKSVALQGLGALDYVLFGRDSESLATGNPFRCEFAGSIGENLDHVASILANEWQENENLRMEWTTPNSANRFFRTEREAMNTVLGILVHGLEAIRDTRINVFLRESPNRDRPKSAAFWRSGFTMLSVAANLEGLEKLFTQSRIETILPLEAQYLGNTLRFEFGQSIKTANELKGSIANILSDPVQRKWLEYFKFTLDILIDRFNTELAPAAGLAAGFSFGDGD